MFDFLFVPTTGSVLKQFTKLQTQLGKVIVYHSKQREAKARQIEDHNQEVKASAKALAALEQFI